jgi:Putative zinc-finger
MVMDHLEAKRIQAAEKYVLGELSSDLRDEYEEHYFDCEDCTADLKAASVFVGVGKQIFQEEAASVPAEEHKKERGGFSAWFAWLRPAIAVPVMAALVAVIVYQNVSGIPKVASNGIATEAQGYRSTYRIRGATRGGTEVTKVAVNPQEAFGLDFDFTPSQIFPNYEGRLTDASGNTVMKFHLAGNLTNQEVHLGIPAGVVTNELYSLVIGAGDDTSTKGEPGVEVQRLSFAVESRP